MDLIAPDLPDIAPDALSAYVSTRRPGLGEALGAQVQQGFQSSGFGALGALGREVQGARAAPELLSREEWEASGLPRPRLQWDERMTRGRAEAMAREYDEREYRRRLLEARDPGAAETALGFVANLVGAVPSPENFVPFAGPAARGLRALGATRAAETLMAPGVGASALRGATDATLGTAAIMPLVLGVDARYGEDVTFGRVVGELAIGALIGAGFGTVGGLLSRGADTRLAPDTMAAVRTVDAAARDVAAGRPIVPPSEMALRAIEDAAARSAPPELRDVPLRDLPTRPDGTPLHLADFEKWYFSRQPITANVWHGTQRDFASLDVNSSNDIGVHFSTSRATAQEFADVGGGAGRIFRARLNITNPLFIDKDLGTWHPLDIAEWIDEAGKTAFRASGDNVGDLTRKVLRAGDGLKMGSDEALAAERAVIRSWLDQNGYDAIQYINQFEGRPVDTFIVWDQTKIDQRAKTIMGTIDQRINAGVDPEINDAFDWYREALDARQQAQRLSSGPPPEAAMPMEMARPETRAADAADPETEAAMAQVEALRAEGRLTPGDEAILRAGDEQAQQLEALSRGQVEAGACLLRNIV